MNDEPAERIERMNRFAERMNEVERDQSLTRLRPRDAATLILVDRSGREPKVLLGKRHARPQIHAGQVRVSRRPREPATGACRRRRPLDPACRSAPDEALRRPSAARARALGARGDPRDVRGNRPAARHAQRRRAGGAGRPVEGFAQAKRAARPRRLHFIGRAITPPRPAAAVRCPLLRRGRQRDRAPHRRRDRPGRRTGRTGLDADRRGASSSTCRRSPA